MPRITLVAVTGNAIAAHAYVHDYGDGDVNGDGNVNDHLLAPAPNTVGGPGILPGCTNEISKMDGQTRAELNPDLDGRMTAVAAPSP